MQRIVSLDPSKNNSVFKKRVHRPWKPALLEAPITESDLENTDDLSLALNALTEKSEFLYSDSHQAQADYPVLAQKAENKLSIGGFLSSSTAFHSHDEVGLNDAMSFMNELKTQEQEILLSAHDRKIAHAVEQAEKMAFAKQTAEVARKTAEERALQAIQQAKYAADHIYKVEQQLQLERQFRTKEEKNRKTLEDKIQSALQVIERKDQQIQQAAKAQQLAEIKIAETTALLSATEQHIREEAKVRIKQIFAAMSKKIRKIKGQSEDALQNASEESAIAQSKAEETLLAAQKQAEEKIKLVQADRDASLKNVQLEANQKIAETQEQCRLHEEAKLTAEATVEKYSIIVREAEIAKKELINKFTIAQKGAGEIRVHLESKIQTLTEQMTTADADKTKLETEKTELERALSEALTNIKKIKLVITAEKNLRKILEEKLTGSQVRKDEQKRKLAENRICELTTLIGRQEIEKNKADEFLSTTLTTVNQLEIMLASEKTIRSTLEVQLKETIEKLNGLEQEKQNEIELKQLAENRITVLLTQKEHYEQEKEQYSEKLQILHERMQTLAGTHELEISKAYEYAHQLTLKHEIEISAAQDHAHQLVIQHESEMRKAQDHAHQLVVQRESEMRKAQDHAHQLVVQHESEMRKAQNRTQQLATEHKTQLKNTVQRMHELEAAVESEKALRKEADRLKAVEEQCKKAAQEKINLFVEQVNKTVSNVLGTTALAMSTDDI